LALNFIYQLMKLPVRYVLSRSYSSVDHYCFIFKTNVLCEGENIYYDNTIEIPKILKKIFDSNIPFVHNTQIIKHHLVSDFYETTN